MPRGRKGPPQESDDSILLAISRRDDISPTMLAHYFERLDEEWTHGARENRANYAALRKMRCSTSIIGAVSKKLEISEGWQCDDGDVWDGVER